MGLAWDLSLTAKLLAGSVPAQPRRVLRARPLAPRRPVCAASARTRTSPPTSACRRRGSSCSALVISSVFGAWAGVLQAQTDGLIGPSQFTFAKGFLMFVAIGIGGYGRLLTPLIGSFLVIGVPELLDLGPGTSQIVLGILFLVVTLAVPGGLIGGAECGRPDGSSRPELAPARRPSGSRAVLAALAVVALTGSARWSATSPSGSAGSPRSTPCR